MKHIIDILIEERAPKLAASKFWPILSPILNLALGYKKAVLMADNIAKTSGQGALDYVSKLLSLKVEMQGFENLPNQGAIIIIANHPTGIADGVALYDCLKTIRHDLKFYANADALRISPRFDEVIIPIEWVYEKRTREKTRLTLQKTQEVIEKQMVLAIFPAGRLARVIDGKLQDPEWAISAISIARKYKVPILPVKIKGPNAFWFHTFDRFSKELRDITLFHELLNKKNGNYSLKAGKLIDPLSLDADSQKATLWLKEYIENRL